MNQEELKEVLRLHGLWLSTNFKEGKPADLCGADLRGANLRGANLRRADLCEASLREASLRGADLCEASLCGADLCEASLCGADLCEANLCEASLRGANLCEANLCEANLRRADLRGANLCEANLRRADLRGANLRRADLRGANLCRANLPVSFKVQGLHKKMLEAIKSNGNKLEMGAWHTCETTHCRAGWAVVLGGEAGRVLEEIYGTAVAGALIYQNSTGMIPDFYASNDVAMADIEKCAKEESENA